MRSRLAFLGALSLAGCTIVVQSPPAGTPALAAEPVVPLEITLARPVNSRLYVQTNRPAYVALFEIVPGQGVTLVQPGNATQRNVVYSGMTWVPAWWMTQRAAQMGRQQSATRTRYVYAVASDRPLTIPDGAFTPEGMRALIGASAYDGSVPATTMRALRRFLPAVGEEYWAEDMLLLDVGTQQQQQVASATVRVYCANGTVYVVPVEVADRAYCPMTSTGAPSRPSAPDSVKHDNGRRVQRRPIQPGSRGVDRVADVPPGLGGANPGVGRPDDRGNNGRRVGQTDTTNPGRRVGQTDTTSPGRRTGRTQQAGRPANPGADSARAPVLINRMPVLKRDTLEAKQEPQKSDPQPVEQAQPKRDSTPPVKPDSAKPDNPKPDNAKPDDAKPETKPDSAAKPDSTRGRDKPKPETPADSARGRGRRPNRP